MAYKLKEAENAYKSNDILEVLVDGEISQTAINLITTGTVSALNLTLKCPKKGGRCLIKLGTDGGQNAVVTLEGCLLEDGNTTITLVDANDEVSLHYYNETAWILVSSKGSVVIS